MYVFLRCNGRASCRINLESIVEKLFPQNCEDMETEKYPPNFGLELEHRCIKGKDRRSDIGPKTNLDI